MKVHVGCDGRIKQVLDKRCMLKDNYWLPKVLFSMSGLTAKRTAILLTARSHASEAILNFPPSAMRPLTEQETKVFFEKLSK